MLLLVKSLLDESSPASSRLFFCRCCRCCCPKQFAPFRASRPFLHFSQQQSPQSLGPAPVLSTEEPVPSSNSSSHFSFPFALTVLSNPFAKCPSPAGRPRCVFWEPVRLPPRSKDSCPYLRTCSRCSSPLDPFFRGCLFQHRK